MAANDEQSKFPAQVLSDHSSSLHQLAAAGTAFSRVMVNELLSRSTQGERDRLLLASLVALAFVATGVKPPDIDLTLFKIPLALPWALPAGLLAVIVYFLLSLAISGWLDRERWRALVGPELHGFLLNARKRLLHRSQSINQMMAEASAGAGLINQLLSLQKQRFDLLTERDRYLAGIKDPTPDELAEMIDPKQVDTVALDGQIEVLKRKIEASRTLQQTSLDAMAAMQAPRSDLLIVAKRSWQFQNIWYLVFPIVIGLFAFAVTSARLISVLSVLQAK